MLGVRWSGAGTAVGVARGLERSSAFPRYVVLAVLPVLCHINDESGNRLFFGGGGSPYLPQITISLRDKNGYRQLGHVTSNTFV